MRLILIAAAMLPLAAAAPAAATAAAPADSAAQAAEAFGDPARQEALARSLGVMAEVLLDIPLAPFVAPLADAVGEDAPAVDPDATLRKLAPGAGDVPRQIEEKLPRAMQTVAGLSGAIATMLPELEALASQVREAIPAELP